MYLFLCHIFTQRLMNDRKLSDMQGFSKKQVLANSIENFISYKKKSVSLPEICKPLKPFRLLNYVSITRVVGWWRFFLKQACRCHWQQRLPQTRKRSVLVLAPGRPSNQPKLYWSTAPRAWPMTKKPVKKHHGQNLWLSCGEWLQDNWKGLKLGLKPELCCLTNE